MCLNSDIKSNQKERISPTFKYTQMTNCKCRNISNIQIYIHTVYTTIYKTSIIHKILQR